MLATCSQETAWWRGLWSALPLGLVLAFLTSGPSLSEAEAQQRLRYRDPQPQVYKLTARASELDPNAKEHPEIDFVFEKDGKPQDVQNAIVDTRVQPRGELVIWLMGHNSALFDRLAEYGFHAVQVHYANKWFGKVCLEKPVGEMCRGDVRLEAATGEDFSDQVDIPKPDGMMERTRMLLLHLARTNPQAGWNHYLTFDGQNVRWDRVVLAGSSHGSTTAARFAVHQRVARVVMLCGPRDQYQNWQKLPSATPTNRYFGFSHVLDGGWTGDHYCRSWELLGLHEHGPIVNVDEVAAPFGNSRRLITTCDVGNNPGKAHSCVTPGGNSCKDADGNLIHEEVWKYMFTHPVNRTGEAVPQDPNCNKEQRDQL